MAKTAKKKNVKHLVLLDVTLLEKRRYNRDLNRLGADKTLGYFSFLYREFFISGIFFNREFF